MGYSSPVQDIRFHELLLALDQGLKERFFKIKGSQKK